MVRTGEPAKIDRPIFSEPFDRYSARTFPELGGWKLGLTSSAGKDTAGITEGTEVLTVDSGITLSGQATKAAYDQGIAAQAGTVAVIDQTEHVSPVRSFRFEQAGSAVTPIVKKFALPGRLPYDVSAAGFSIVAQDTELADIMDGMIEERTQSDAAGSGAASDAPQASQPNSPAVTSPGAGAGSVSTMTTLSVPRTGSYYIYTFDGRPLAEYDLLGNCLRDYIYMGGRLIAEYDPATAQYYYYTQDQIGSTRVVTDDLGAVVYAEAHDPYGGVQKTWTNTFDPKRKFADKERDQETGLDYFGARFYSAPMYRWISVDPALYREVAINNPQAWNLYSFCRNNPINLIDPSGQVVYADEGVFARLQEIFGILGILLTRDASGRVRLPDFSPQVLQQIIANNPELEFLIDAINDESTIYYACEGGVAPYSGGYFSMADEAGINFTTGNEWRPAVKRPPIQYDAVIVINPCAQTRYGGWEEKEISTNAILYHEFAEAYANIKFGWYKYSQIGVCDERTGHYWAGTMEQLMLKNNPDFTACPAGVGPRGPFGGEGPHKYGN